MSRRSRYLLPVDANKLMDLLKASLLTYTRNGGRKVDWLKKLGISSRTWYKWAAQECPRIRKKTSVRLTKFSEIDPSELPEFISESINPTIILNKDFKGYLDTYFYSDLVMDSEKIILYSSFLVMRAAELGLDLRYSLDIKNVNCSITIPNSSFYIKVKKENVLVFELFSESTTVCRGEFTPENIIILIKWLHKKLKSIKNKPVKTLYEQFRKSIAG
jgi:hypothetical protein